MIQALQRVWHRLTAPQSKDLNVARQEYMTRVLLLLFVVVLGPVLVIITISKLLGSIQQDLPLVLGGAFWVGLIVCLTEAQHGKWRWGSHYLITCTFLISLQGSLAVGILQHIVIIRYIVVLIVTSMLGTPDLQWLMLGLSMITYLLGSDINALDGEARIIAARQALILTLALGLIGSMLWFLMQQYRQVIRVLESRTVELEHLNKEVKEFAYIIAHDLRAPLVNMRGFASELHYVLAGLASVADGLIAYADPEDRKTIKLAIEEDIPEALNFIDTSAERMEQHIAALLKLSHMERRELQLEVFSLEPLVQQTLQNLAHQIQERQITLEIDKLPNVYADKAAMEVVFDNLIGNAVKYLSPNRPGRITITVENGGENITFHIQDNGRGIAEENQEKVFAPFRRVGVQDVEGMGMGLPYVRTLIRRHGGKIWFQSESGVGSTFSFTLPHSPERKV
ncbi:MAG: HAMP domain-containing histidine kinase [Anaerolineae bacterium]|nr:HAMP domain-containing histidine kinase [Anaerolineae bacterium]